MCLNIILRDLCNLKVTMDYVPQILKINQAKEYMNVRPVKQQVYSMTKIVSGTQYVFSSMSKWLIIYELDLTI